MCLFFRGFFVGFMIPLITMVLALLVFVLGSSKYIISKPQGSVVAKTLNICWEAVWTNRQAETGGSAVMLDRSKHEHGGSYSDSEVEMVKLVTRLFPFLVCVIGNMQSTLHDDAKLFITLKFQVLVP